jgi:hypothetical protein
MARVRRCVRVAEHGPFREVEGWVHAALKPAGFVVKRLAGSSTWMAGPHLKGSELEGVHLQALVKLAFYGPGNILLGIREEFARKFPQLREVAWTSVFSVPPAVAVTFCGFPVGNDERSKERISRVLRPIASMGLPASLPESAADSAIDAELDRHGL